MSPFLAWGEFHARSRFPRSTIPEEKLGTTRTTVVCETKRNEMEISTCEMKICSLRTTDFHFANYRFPFRKLQISISFHFVSQTTVSPRLAQRSRVTQGM